MSYKVDGTDMLGWFYPYTSSTSNTNTAAITNYKIDGEPMNPEYPCGDIDFSFYIDILHNKYELKKFILSYDINKCGPEIPNQQEDVPDNIN